VSSPASTAPAARCEGRGPRYLNHDGMNEYYVYMLASGRNETLYVGVTNDLGRRLGEHKQKRFPDFHAAMAWTCQSGSKRMAKLVTR
jgi:hypothetical protein